MLKKEDDSNHMKQYEKAEKSRTKAVVNVIKNESLIEMHPSLAGLSSSFEDQHGSIYYGTGLTTPRAIAVGLPFDILGMILVAEHLRKTGELEDIYHHIADTHAKTNEWIDPKEVDKRAEIVKETLEKVARNMGLNNFHVKLSSEFDQTKEYEEMLASFPKSDKHEYVKREMADMEWYRLKHGVVMKCGWIIQATETDLGFDERVFDREYSKFRGTVLSFIYTKPGRTFDKSRPKVSPYIQVAGETRLLLQKGENVRKKMEDAIKESGDQHLGGAKKHLESIVRLYEKLYGNLGRQPLEDKIQMIIDKLTA